MELKEISPFEAKMNDLPAGEPDEGEISIWYALEDEEAGVCPEALVQDIQEKGGSRHRSGGIFCQYS